MLRFLMHGLKRTNGAVSSNHDDVEVMRAYFCSSALNDLAVSNQRASDFGDLALAALDSSLADHAMVIQVTRPCPFWATSLDGLSW